MSPRKQALVTLAAGAVILGMFFYFARPGLSYYFDDDDIMNLRAAWPVPVKDLLGQMITFAPNAYRPAHMLYYRLIFNIAGFHPHPFHWVTFGFLSLNLALLFYFAKALTDSTESALLATLLGAFHSRMDPLYFTMAATNDTLSFTCYFAFLVLYLRFRSKTPLMVFLVLNVLALNLKEMAATLPFMLLACDLLYGPPARVLFTSRWLLREGRVLLASTLLTVAFCVQKLFIGTTLVTSYKPELSLGRFFENWQSYLALTFYSEQRPGRWLIVTIWIAVLTLALLRRSKPLFACCVLILIGPLPSCIIEPRALTTWYIPFAGWVIFAATLLVWFRRGIAPNLTAGPALLFLLTATALTFAHLHDRPNRFYPGNGKSELIRNFKADFIALHPSMAAGAHILLVDDPFDANEWTPSSLLQLYYREPELDVQRIKQTESRANIQKMAWDYTLTYKYGHVTDLAPSQSYQPNHPNEHP